MQPLVAVPATLALVYRAYSHKSLTPLGILVAALTAIAHALHPWPVFFTLLCVFFLAGTAVTKVKQEVKARLTVSASDGGGVGSSGGGGTKEEKRNGGEGPRTHVQVLANSVVASVLILLHAYSIMFRKEESYGAASRQCFSRKAADVLVVGIVGNYVAVAADTFSSELGILSTQTPFLITNPLRRVPRGTNGGVTLAGLGAGLAGSALLALTAVGLLPFCSTADLPSASSRVFDKLKGGNGGGNLEPWDLRGKAELFAAATALGLLGSIVDSILGALLQASVVDVRSGKVIEGKGGRKVLVSSTGASSSSASHLSYTTVAKSTRQRASKPVPEAEAEAEHGVEVSAGQGQASRRIDTGRDLLSNNGVNLAMAASMSAVGMLAAATIWGVEPMDIVRTFYGS